MLTRIIVLQRLKSCLITNSATVWEVRYINQYSLECEDERPLYCVLLLYLCGIPVFCAQIPIFTHLIEIVTTAITTAK